MQTEIGELPGIEIKNGEIVLCDGIDYEGFHPELYLQYTITPDKTAYKWFREIEPVHMRDELHYNLNQLHDGVYQAKYLFECGDDNEDCESDSAYIAVVNSVVKRFFEVSDDVISWLKDECNYIELKINSVIYENRNLDEAVLLISEIIDRAIPTCMIRLEKHGDRNVPGKFDSVENLLEDAAEQQNSVQDKIRQWIENIFTEMGRDSRLVTYDITVREDQLKHAHRISLRISDKWKKDLAQFVG